MTRWQDWDDLILGLLIFASPWILGDSTQVPAGAWTAWVLGGAIMLVACIAVLMPRLWEEPINLLLGISLILSPWVLGFGDEWVAVPFTTVAGVLVSGLAVSALLVDDMFLKWWHDGHHLWTR